jgi:TonB family protein
MRFDRFAARWLAGVAVLGGCVPVFSAQAQETTEGRPHVGFYRSAEERPSGLLRPVLPLGDMREWAGPSDYPESEWKAGAEGTVTLRVEVDAQGRITRCTVVRATAPGSLQALACTLLSARGKFRHALSATGKPVASEVRMSVWFELPRPKDQILPPAPPRRPPANFHAESYHPSMKPTGELNWQSLAPPGRPNGELVVSLTVIPPYDKRYPPYVDRPESRSCSILESSGDPVLDAATCMVVEAGQYEIQPGHSYNSLKMLVRWRDGKASHVLPTRSHTVPLVLDPANPDVRASLPTGLITQRAWVEANFRADGKVECRVLQSSGSDEGDRRICAHFRTKIRFTPAIDLFGRKVPTIREFRVDP